MAAKNEIFPLGTEYCCTTLWVQKFVPNHSILYGFKDIHTFSFSAKIKDGRQKIFTLSHLLLEIIRIYSF